MKDSIDRHRLLINITDEDAIKAAAIAKIGNNPTVTRSGTAPDIDCVIITDGKKDRSIKIYFNGSNTRIYHQGVEVIEYCFSVYDYLRSLGYKWEYKDIPEFETLPSNTEDDVEKLAYNWLYSIADTINKGNKYSLKALEEGFIAGYKQAKSETMFSLEHMRKIWEAGIHFNEEQNYEFLPKEYVKWSFDLIIQSLTKPKEYKFVPEMEAEYIDYPKDRGGIVKPKIVNNKIQGKWK